MNLNKILKNLRNKRGMITIGSLLPVVLTVVVVVLVAAAGLITLTAFKNSGHGSTAVNTTIDNGIGLFTNLFSQFDTIGLMLGLAILIGVVIVGFAVYQSRRGGGL